MKWRGHSKFPEEEPGVRYFVSQEHDNISDSFVHTCLSFSKAIAPFFNHSAFKWNVSSLPFHTYFIRQI